jgi:hypothetical protein
VHWYGPGSEYRQQNAVLIALQIDIFPQTSDVGIGESLTICFALAYDILIRNLKSDLPR